MTLMICLDDSESAQTPLKAGLKVVKEIPATVYIVTSIEKGNENWKSLLAFNVLGTATL